MADKKSITFPHLRIENDTIEGRKAKIFINGQDVSEWLSDVSVHFDVSGTVEATFTCVIGHLEIDAQAEILAKINPADESGITDTTAFGCNSRRYALTSKDKAQVAWKCDTCWKFNAVDAETCQNCGAKKGKK